MHEAGDGEGFSGTGFCVLNLLLPMGVQLMGVDCL